ncbi:hypothetical protein BS47DRAFT_699079 [Hydnum rufescens UP504]|uniref:Uncharacterized protein n=1 Tax=Hydnum rufescens UP504 TaxID=1448309 RepID=A0A9P6AE75_9AGAM|nr:hypothetical protein BS47DRAFT_699079 [Hydnum rufescens UP504]
MTKKYHHGIWRDGTRDSQQLWLIAVFFLTVSFSPGLNLWILGQSTTEAILRSHLSRLGVTVELGTELVDFTQDAHKGCSKTTWHQLLGRNAGELSFICWCKDGRP